MFTRADIEKYFLAEKQESMLFIIIGIAAIVAAGIFYLAVKSPGFRGAAFPLLIIGVIQIAVGYTVYSRADAQRKDIVYKLDMNPDSLRDREIPRMEAVMRNFTLYRWVEIALLLVGISLALQAKIKVNNPFVLGLGLALALQAALMLGADYFAEKRGAEYLKGLKSVFVPKD
jgi:drug/metabolite transporter (DMT)-like permease